MPQAAASYKISEMPATFGVRIDFAKAHRLGSDEAKKAILAAINAIPADRFSKFNNGKLTLVL